MHFIVFLNPCTFFSPGSSEPISELKHLALGDQVYLETNATHLTQIMLLNDSRFLREF